MITTGEGGMCLTDNDSLAEKMRNLRDHGMSKHKRYWHDILGYNYRMTNMQAAVGVAQLKKLDSFIDAKRRIAETYKRELKILEDNGLIKLPPEAAWAKNVYWLYSILLMDRAKVNRETLMAELRKNGIDTRPFFYPINEMPIYKTDESFPVTEDISKRGINLPSFTELTQEQIKFIADKIKSILA
jgi:perosamine synthetase